MPEITSIQRLAEIVAQGVEWQTREGREPIALERWGLDHWNLLLYVETRTVDYNGLINWEHLTLSIGNWPMLYAARRDVPDEDAADEYGLRLKAVDGNPVTLFGHCDVDALMDLVEAKLIAIEMPKADKGGDYFLKPDGMPLTDEQYPSPRFVTGAAEWQLMPWARFRLTDSGRTVANELRAHKATDGATCSNFTPATR